MIDDPHVVGRTVFGGRLGVTIWSCAWRPWCGLYHDTRWGVWSLRIGRWELSWWPRKDAHGRQD